MYNVLFVMNPNAGKGAMAGSLVPVLEILEKADCRVEMYISKYRGDIIESLPERALGKDIVISCGGDGTMNEVVRGLAKIRPDKRPRMGLIPVGTTNDFAKSHNIPGDFELAAKLITTGIVRDIDIGCLNGEKYFEYVAGFGAFTATSYNVSQSAKTLMGYSAYILAGASEVMNMVSTPCHIKWDDGERDDEILFALVSNSTQVAGFKDKLAYDIDTNDGLFEMLLVRKPSDIYAFPDMISSLLQIKDGKYVERIKTSHVSFTFSQPVAWVMDGEHAGDFLTVDIDNIHSAVQLIESDKPLETPWNEVIDGIWKDFGYNPMPGGTL